MIASLHPEELFDKPSLTPAERARLDSHLRACSTCRIEQAMRADFAEELAADKTPPFSAKMLSAALGSARPKPKAPSRLRPWLLFAAAICTLATLAGAQHASLIGLGTPRTLHDVEVRLKPAPAAAPTPVAAPIPVAEPAPVASSLPAPPADTAASLFDRIATTRQRREYDQSIAACRTLQARFPASREAQVSRGTLGRLLLDRGDAEGALGSFADYERHGGGSLDEAVLVGRATAYERLGRKADARRAWATLLDSFPSTPYADQARAQLEP